MPAIRGSLTIVSLAVIPQTDGVEIMQPQRLRDGIDQCGVRHRERNDVGDVDFEEIDFVEGRVDAGVADFDEDEEDDGDEQPEGGDERPDEAGAGGAFDDGHVEDAVVGVVLVMLVGEGVVVVRGAGCGSGEGVVVVVDIVRGRGIILFLIVLLFPAEHCPVCPARSCAVRSCCPVDTHLTTLERTGGRRKGGEVAASVQSLQNVLTAANRGDVDKRPRHDRKGKPLTNLTPLYSRRNYDIHRSFGVKARKVSNGSISTRQVNVTDFRRFPWTLVGIA